jgi:hypothetical protein
MSIVLKHPAEQVVMRTLATLEGCNTGSHHKQIYFPQIPIFFSSLICISEHKRETSLRGVQPPDTNMILASGLGALTPILSCLFVLVSANEICSRRLHMFNEGTKCPFSKSTRCTDCFLVRKSEMKLEFGPPRIIQPVLQVSALVLFMEEDIRQ